MTPEGSGMLEKLGDRVGYVHIKDVDGANGYFRRLEQNTLERVPADARVQVLFDHRENRKRFERLRHVQEKHDLSVGQVVLGYLTGQPFPVFPLVGPETLADLQDNLRSVETRLSRADILYLERGEEQNERSATAIDRMGQN